MASHRWAIDRQTSRSDLQTAEEWFACKMSVERIERKAERLGRNIGLCDVSKYVQICNYIDEGQMQWQNHGCG
jgi:hypothetical protein